MVKRAREEHGPTHDGRPPKRTAFEVDRLSALSTELRLQILSHLLVSQLVVIGRLSKQYHRLAQDDQLWKAHYYDRFVRPRASRLPGFKDSGSPHEDSILAHKTAKWLDDDHLVRSGGHTNWKRQYKLRHNWARGRAAVTEISVADHAPIPPTLVTMHDKIVFTVDKPTGLRAWNAKYPKQMIAQLPFPDVQSRGPPTAIAVDVNAEEGRNMRTMIGFENGSYSLCLLDREAQSLVELYKHSGSTNGVVSSVALSWPYALTMTATQLLSLYRFEESATSLKNYDIREPPRLLHSLKSHTVWPPISTSLRTSASAIFVCVAYTLPTYLSGFTVGVQEIKVTPEGRLLDSRLTSAIETHYRPLAFSTRPMMHHMSPLLTGASTSSGRELRHIHSKPTSISYTHPYLLVGHPDNTLTLYLVTSTANALSISAGSRLWGHTSSVSGAHVSSRGKAVSISRRGDELRVWELEGGFGSTAARKRLAGTDLSVRVQPDDHDRGTANAGKALLVRPSQSSCGTQHVATDASELSLTRGWIGFDEENVVVLQEESQGKQALIVYDFT